MFVNSSDNTPVNKKDIPAFLNEYFANIAGRVRPSNNFVNDNMGNLDIKFMPPTLAELYGICINIDTSISSCIDGLNTKMCKKSLGYYARKIFKNIWQFFIFGYFPPKMGLCYVNFSP